MIKAAHDRGIVPIYWDNGALGTVQFPTVLEAMTRAVTSSYTLSQVAKP